MKRYIHTVKDPLGIHVRPAGLIVKLAKKYPDTCIVFSCDGKEAKATSLIKLMSLGMKRESEIIITADGGAEEAAIIAVSNFVNNNL